jgi:hypothetical protein
MDPKSVAVISALVGFASFLAINKVISDPNFNPSSALKFLDVKAFVLSRIPETPKAGFSKLLSQKSGVALEPETAAPKENTAPQTPKPVKEITIRLPSPTSVTTTQPVANTPTQNNNPTPSNKIEITEDQINHNLNSYIPSGTPVQNLKVKLVSGKINVTGRLLSPIQGDLFAQATLTYTNSNLAVKIQGASLGTLAVPPSLLSSLEAATNQTVNTLLNQTHGTANIKSIEIQEGKILITF